MMGETNKLKMSEILKYKIITKKFFHNISQYIYQQIITNKYFIDHRSCHELKFIADMK